MRRLLLVPIALAALQAQSFEVASIHPHDPASREFLVRPPVGGHFTAVGAVAKFVIMLAYDVQDSQLVGGPGWLDSDKWDIEAKSLDDKHDPEETRRMLQNMLAERFSLQVHREMQKRSVYALTVAKGGPKFRPSAGTATNLQVSSNSVSLRAGGMAQLSGILATALGRPVVDETGLTGSYDLSAQWDDAPVRAGGVPGTEISAPGNDRGSIFTALQDQLGLRLVPQQTSVEVLVIDRMGRPSEN